LAIDHGRARVEASTSRLPLGSDVLPAAVDEGDLVVGLNTDDGDRDEGSECLEREHYSAGIKRLKENRCLRETEN